MYLPLINHYFLFISLKLPFSTCSHIPFHCWLACTSSFFFFLLLLKFFIFIYFFYFTVLYWFCHTVTWIRHGCTYVPHPICLGHSSATALSTLYHASNLDWRFVSHMTIYMFQCHSPISSHPRPLLQSPKDCSIHLCLFCCLAYRVIVTIFLNSIYMC